jgi:hypothetical protein
VITAISNTYSTTNLVQKILNEYRIIRSEGKVVSFKTIQKTSDAYNIVKELAKRGSTSHRSIDYDLMPISFIKNMIYTDVLNEWNYNWNQSTSGRTTFAFIPTVDYRLKIKKHFCPTFELTQLLTNHGKFNAYLNKYHIKNSPNCERCGEGPEDVDHLIFNCKELAEQRLELQNKCQEIRIQWPCDKRNLLNSKLYDNFSTFCNLILNND